MGAPHDEDLVRRRRPDLLPAAVVVDDRAAIRDALQARAGAGVLPAFLGEPARGPAAVVRLDDEPLAWMDVHAVFLPEQRPDVQIRLLFELIEAPLQLVSARQRGRRRLAGPGRDVSGRVGRGLVGRARAELGDRLEDLRIDRALVGLSLGGVRGGADPAGTRPDMGAGLDGHDEQAVAVSARQRPLMNCRRRLDG